MIGDKKATVLLVTLWILAILSLLAIGIGFRTSIELKLVGYQIDSLKAYEIAKAGVLKAINELEKDEAPNIDTIWECGITLKPDETLEGRFKDIKVGEGHFDVSLEDIQARININTAPMDILKALSLNITPEIAKNIMKWRGALPAELGDYSDKPYDCKKAPFDIPQELLLVKDVTQELFDEIKGFITAYGPKEFKVNINTASQKTLEALLDAAGFEKTIAAEIVRYREGPDGDITKVSDNVSFNNSTDFRDYFIKTFLSIGENGSISPQDDTKLNNLINLLSCNSSYFRIWSIGILDDRKSKISRTITCIVERGSDKKIAIIGWLEQ